MINRKKACLWIEIAAIAASCTFVAGCTTKQERLEKEDAYRTIGINAMENGNYTEAIEAFDSALELADVLGTNEKDICYYRAAAQFAAGDLNDAIETYNALLESDDKNSDAYFLRGSVYLKMNESIKALEDYEKAIQYAENDEIYLVVYNSLNGAGYETEAKDYLEKALEKKAGRKAENYTVKGKIYLLKEMYPEAIESLATAIEKGDVEANLYLARAYEASGEAVKAEECINAYIEVNPESSVAYNQRGKKKMEEGNYEEAISEFLNGLELEQVIDEQELRSNLIAAYEYSGDFEKAKELMGEYVEDYPGDAAAAREYLFLGKNRNEEPDTK